MNGQTKTGSYKTGEKGLIERIRNGERELYRVLVDRHSPMVFHLIRRYIKDEDEVQEMAQDLFVRAWEKLDQFDGRSAFSTWLYTMARNRCLDFVKNIRRQQSRFSEMEPGVVEKEMSTSETPHEKLEGKERWHRLMEAIEELNEDHSEPLLLKYRDGYSYKMISAMTGIPETTLKVRVHRARKEIIASMQSADKQDQYYESR